MQYQNESRGGEIATTMDWCALDRSCFSTCSGCCSCRVTASIWINEVQYRNHKAIDEEWRKPKAPLTGHGSSFPCCGTFAFAACKVKQLCFGSKRRDRLFPTSLLCLYDGAVAGLARDLFLQQRTWTIGLTANGMGRFADTTCKYVNAGEERLPCFPVSAQTLAHLHCIFPPSRRLGIIILLKAQ